MPDDARYGPWARKLLTGDENSGAIFAIGTNGSYDTYYLGIQPDDFHIIEAGQDIYCVNFQDNDSANSKILKISRNFLTNYVGDILIAQAGEILPDLTARLFFVHWDSKSQQFLTRAISLPPEISGHLEHVTVAPANIPDL